MARSNYQTRYAVELQSAFGTAVSTLSTGIQDSSLAVDVDKSGILLNDNPPIDPGVETIDQRKSVGSASRRGGIGAEYQMGHRNPTASWGFDVSTRVLFPFLEVFFQSGRVTSAAEAKWYAPHSYTAGVVDTTNNGKALTIVQDLGGSNSQKVQDMIAASLEITGDETTPIQASVELMGGEHDTSYDASSDDFNYAAVAPLLFMNAQAFLGDGSTALEAADVPGLSVTLNNGAVAKHYNSEYITRFQLADFTGSGTLNMPWNSGTSSYDDDVMLERFVSGSVTRLVFGWGASAAADLDDLDTDNDMTIALLIRYTGATIGGEDELMTELPFDLVEYPTITTEDNISSFTVASGVVTPTFSGSETLVGNVYPGDVAIIDQTTYTIASVDWGSGTFTLDDTGVNSGTDLIVLGQPVIIGINDSQAR